MVEDSYQSPTEPTISSIREDLETKYRSYLPIRIGSAVAYGLIDSGNCLENALSLDLFYQLSLNQNHLEPYHIPRVGTARKGTHLNIKGRLKHPLTFMVGTKGQTLKIQPVVIDGLSMGLNISGPYLAKRGIDQIHSKNSLLLDGRLLPLVSYRHRTGVASLPSEITSSHLQEYPLPSSWPKIK